MRNETVYGEGILSEELNRLDDYVVVTDWAPWQLYKSYFARQPVRVIMPETLEQSDLDEMAAEIPEEASIVGVGGGSVIDAAKYFAYLREKTPTLVPTITSSNAQFSDFISVRRNRRPFGFKKDGWPRRIIVDYELIQLADKRFNRAGYGDVLSVQTTLNDWQIAAKAGKVPPPDPALETEISEKMQVAIESAPDVGSVTRHGIEFLMKFFEHSVGLGPSDPSETISAGADHLFAWNLEGVTDRHFIHGEIVSLGIVISSYLQKTHFFELQEALRKAEVIHHPDKLGISREELKETLLTVDEYNRNVRKSYTIFDEVEWTPRLLDEVQELIFA